MYIKICGITNKEEYNYIANKNVDFIGFVMFYEKSKRNMTVEKVKEIISNHDNNRNVIQDDNNGVHTNEISNKVTKVKNVAVMVSPNIEQIRMAEDAGLDILQIHGRVSDELIKACRKPVFKAFNVNDLEHYEKYCSFEQIKGFVFDANEPGSGKTFDWDMINGLKRTDKLFILSGGLNADNVKTAIEYVHPDGVDVSSGVEFSKEQVGKDLDKVDRFVDACTG